MQVIRARMAGFCMGVSLALRKLDRAVASHPRGKVSTLGPIIHNPQVLEQYRQQGVGCLSCPEEAEPGQCVLIRAHGVPREGEARLCERGVEIIDATCPRVKEAQLAIAEATAHGIHAADAPLLLYGEAEHPEVQGLLSYAAGSFAVFSHWEQCEQLLHDLPAGPVVVAAQTTQDRQAFDALTRNLQSHLPELVVLDTICDATRRRQAEVGELGRLVDALVVVGGKQSGNTRRLADISTQSGVPTLLVEQASELDPNFFLDKKTVGLTAGASTPKSIIDTVESRLKTF